MKGLHGHENESEACKQTSQEELAPEKKSIALPETVYSSG
jgi:hypothetical protein